MAANKFLDIPPVAQRDKTSFELIRVWIAEQNQHVSIRTGVWDDPSYWGMMLADLAQHIANAHAMQDDKIDMDDFLDRLRDGFDAEMDSPSDDAEGTLTQ